MKQVLTVQDLSCLGKCSLTVALPVLSAMGCSCTPLPTAVLSAHTGFPDPHVRDLTEDMEKILRHWQSIDAKFDAVSVGYLSDPRQAAAVEAVLDAFPAPVILDPAMGDSGKLYNGITDAHIKAMKQLCRKATVLLPNMTEAALLTGAAYAETPDPAYCRSLIEKLKALGAKTVILTGVSLEDGKIGCFGEDFALQNPKLPSCHGTGDLFAAVFTGAYVQGNAVADCAARAADFVSCCLAVTESSAFGLNFESQLRRLA